MNKAFLKTLSKEELIRLILEVEKKEIKKLGFSYFGIVLSGLLFKKVDKNITETENLKKRVLNEKK